MLFFSELVQQMDFQSDVMGTYYAIPIRVNGGRRLNS